MMLYFSFELNFKREMQCCLFSARSGSSGESDDEKNERRKEKKRKTRSEEEQDSMRVNCDFILNVQQQQLFSFFTG